MMTGGNPILGNLHIVSVHPYLVAHPTNRKRVTTLVISMDKWGQVVHSKNWAELTHLNDERGMNHQVENPTQILTALPPRGWVEGIEGARQVAVAEPHALLPRTAPRPHDELVRLDPGKDPWFQWENHGKTIEKP